MSVRVTLAFCLAPALVLAQGTSLPLNTWTNLNGGGFTQSPVGYDSTRWVGSPLNAHCTWGNYHTRGVTSEIQDAFQCYRYNENYFTVIEQGGGAHGIHHAPGGHQVGVSAWLSGDNYLFWQSDGSYGNSVETIGEAWMFDAPGLTTRSVPLPTSSSNANKLTRPWFSSVATPLNLSLYDPAHSRLLIVPDYRNASTQQNCVVSGGQLTTCAPTSTTNAPPLLQVPSGAYDSANGLLYVMNGLIGAGVYNSSVYTYDTALDRWAVLTTTCSGADCVGTHPPVRGCAGVSYSTTDDKFLMIGGNNASTSCNASTAAFTDTWTFNPATLVWTELCNSCGYATTSQIFDKLTYDPISNVFLYFDQDAGYTGSGPWAYAISTPLNYGRTAVTPPSLAGSVNRTTPSGSTQGYAFDPSTSVSGTSLYVAHVEDAPDADHTNCQVPKTYIGSLDSSGANTWYPGGTLDSACNNSMVGEPNSLTPQSHPFAATIGGVLMEVSEKHNFNGALGATASHSFYQTYDSGSGTWKGDWTPQAPGGSLVVGSNTVALSPVPTGMAVGSVVLVTNGTGGIEFDTITAISGSNVTFSARYVHSGAWTIGPSGYVPCGTRDCNGMAAAGTAGKVSAYPAGLIDVGGVPTLSQIEQDTTATNPREHNVFVMQYASNVWTPRGTRLNVNGAGTAVYYASAPATDGSGNIAECWTEGVNSSRNTMTLSPQLYCKKWNGSAWSLMGSGSLNQAASNWAYGPPSAIWHSGAWYVAYTEQAASGSPVVYVQRYNSGANTWSLVGGAAQNVSGTGLDYHASLATDGASTLYLAFEEQSARGQHALGHVKTWNGSAWSALGSSIANDLTNGSIQDISIQIVSGTPMVAFAELTYDNLQQINAQKWNGSAWVSALAVGSTAPTILDTSPLSGGIAAIAYTHQFSASGSPAPTFSATGLPSGSTLNSAGLFSWASPTAGTSSFAVTATNSAGSDGPHTFSVTIASSGVPPTITSTNTFLCTAGAGCTISLLATGTSPFTWSVISGTLPAGLTVTDPVVGTISGVPATTGITTVTVQAANGFAPNATQSITITVAPPAAIPITTQERLYPATMGGSNITGVPRTAEPVTFGIPFPDDATNGITSVNELGLQGASLGQFRLLASWPSGRVKWALVDTQASLAANATNTSVLVTGGIGNFGGANLATDNGATITVATGAATFTVKKANFNLLDVVTIGATTLVSTGTSPGLVVTGPDPTASYPGNVTCLPTGGGSACATDYKSSNDASSTVVIEENGPAKTVLKADGDLIDGAAHTYMHFTVRLFFYAGKTTVKMTTILRNADNGTSGTFATAFKGHQGLEARIGLNVSGTTNYSFANETGTPTTGTLAGSDAAYIYQGLSTFMSPGGTAPANNCPASHDSNGYCVLRTTDTGYVIAKNGSSVRTGTSAQIPQGWGDIADSGGAGVEIGQFLMAAYGAKSLEFHSAGADVRIGILASENSQPFYQAWPQYQIDDVWFNFHTSAVSAPSDEFLKFQVPLAAHADRRVYNNASVFFYPILDPAEEDSFYSSLATSAHAALSTSTTLVLKDSAAAGSNTTYVIYPWLYRAWEAGGGGNQMDFTLGQTLNFIKRGYTGGLLNARNLYRFAAGLGFPRADGFTWRSQSTSLLDGFGQPLATSANSSLSTRSWPATWEHVHIYGMETYYYLTGDETVREGLAGPLERYLNPRGVKPGTERGVGGAFMNIAHLMKHFQGIGDTTTYNALLTQGETVYTDSVAPALCVSGYPAGCSTTNSNGVSRTRGLFYAGTGTISVGPSSSEPFCNGSPASFRGSAGFQISEFLEGMWEFRSLAGSGWSDYTNAFDLMYGVAQWALSEGYHDDATAAWGPNTASTACAIPGSAPVPDTTVYPSGLCGNGYRHYVLLDVANSCSIFYYPIRAEQTVWFPFFVTYQYTGSTAWEDKFRMALQRTAFVGASDEFGFYTIAATMGVLDHPGTTFLNTVPITSVVNNGGGSYTLHWTPPGGVTSYRIKYGTQTFVEWIGYDPTNNAFTGDPTTQQNWFSGTEAAAPIASDAPGVYTVTGLPTSGVTFALKAWSSGAVTTSGSSLLGVVSATIQ